MGFDVSVEEKRSVESAEGLRADGKWHRISIDGVTEQPVTPGETDFEVDLYGPQAELRSQRIAGTIAVSLVRLPSGDRFSPCRFPISPDDVDWAAVLTSRRTVSPSVKAIAIEYKTRVPGLKLQNRVYSSDRR